MKMIFTESEETNFKLKIKSLENAGVFGCCETIQQKSVYSGVN